MRFLLCASILLTLNQVASSDVKQEHVLMGKDVHLLIPTPDLIQDARRLTWKYNKTDILEYTFRGNTEFTHPTYRGRVTSKKDYSLLLKNLTKSDIGLYQAVLSKDDHVPIAKYNVTVEDAVSPVNMTVSFSPDSCNLTVTCSTKDSSVTNTFTCDNTQHCSKQGGESSEVKTSTGLLSLYMSDKSVICSHSNLVSWSNDTNTTPLCQLDSGVSNDDRSHIIVISVVVCIAVIAALCGAAVIAARKCNIGAKYNVPDTTYADVKTSDPAMTNADSANAQHPETVYSMVQHHTGPAPTATTETRNTTATTPETLYSQVKKTEQSTN